jgi:hypothetical protein
MREAGLGYRPGDAWRAGAGTAEPDRQGSPLAGAPGWHVVERPKPAAGQVHPQPEPEPEPDPPAHPLAPLAAGAALSVLVLMLTFFDQGWPDWLIGGSGPVDEPAVAVGTIEDPPLQAAGPDPRPAEPAVAIDGPAGASAPGEEPLPLAAPSSASPPPIASASPTLAAPTPAGPVGQDPISPNLAGPVAQDRSPPIPVPRPAGLAQARAASVPEPAGAAPAGIVQAAFGEPAQPGGVADADAGIRVFIHYTAGHTEDAELARRLAAFLELRGFPVADVRPVSFPIGDAGLRYFFARDRDASWRLFEEIDWFFESMPERAPQRAADFTHYAPKPRPGNVEVWLPTS